MSLAVLYVVLTSRAGLGAPIVAPSQVGSLFRTCLDCDGRFLVGTTQSGKLVVWDARTGRAIRTLKGYRDPIVLARLTPDGQSVLGQSLDPHTDWATWGMNDKAPRDRSMRLWSIRSGKVVWHIPDGLFDAFSRDGRRVYGVVSRVSPNVAKPRLRCWDLRSGSPVFTMPGFSPRGFLSNIAEENADGRRLLYADPSGATVFDLESHKQILHVGSTRLMGTPPAALVGTGDRFLYVGPPGDKGAMALYSIPKNEVVDRIEFPKGRPPLVLGWLPRLEGFVAFCDGRWMSYRRGTNRTDFGPAPEAPDEILVSRDERYFAAWKVFSLGDTRTFKIACYDTATCTKRWERPGIGIQCLSNGEVAVEDRDSVMFVDMESGKVERTIRRAGFYDKPDE